MKVHYCCAQYSTKFVGIRPYSCGSLIETFKLKWISIFFKLTFFVQGLLETVSNQMKEVETGVGQFPGHSVSSPAPVRKIEFGHRPDLVSKFSIDELKN